MSLEENTLHTSLKSKRILIGVTGGVAAYKSAELTRKLVQHGADVRVIMSKSACDFITPTLLHSLCGNEPYTETSSKNSTSGMPHIDLASWPDLILIAPATANTIAKIANGLADNLLTNIVLASNAPIAIAPAMNINMWEAPATQKNLKSIGSYQYEIWGPADGEQACGATGLGRMLEVADLLEKVSLHFSKKPSPESVKSINTDKKSSKLATKTLKDLHILITAGPTQEPIDPVRYVSNHSSGKQGFAIAQQAANMGAKVTLISGPVYLPTPENTQRINVISAEEMYQATMENIKDIDIFFSVAAVADYKPTQYIPNKVKRNTEHDLKHLKLTHTHDILKSVTQSNSPPFVVGFSAEYENLFVHAQRKLIDKQADLIIANLISLPEIGFNTDDNEVTAIWHNHHQIFPKASKQAIAQRILDLTIELFNKKNITLKKFSNHTIKAEEPSL